MSADPSTMSRRRDLWRIGLTVIAFAGSGATTAGFAFVLAHAFGRAEYGSVARAYALAMALAQIVMAGVVPALGRIVGAGDGPDGRSARAASALPRVLGCGLLLVPVYVGLALIGLGSTKTPHLLLGALLVCVYPTYFGGKVFLFVLDEVDTYALLELTSDVVFFAVLIAFAFVAPAIALAAFSMAYGWFVIRLWRRLRRNQTGLPVTKTDVRFGLLALLATYSTAARIPLVVSVVGAATNSYAAATIAAIASLALPLQLVPQAVAMLAFADVARDGERGREFVRTMSAAVAAVSGCVIAAVMVSAGPIVDLALGARYAGTGSSLAILVGGMSMYIAMMPVGNALAGAGLAGLNAMSGGIGMVVAVAGAALLAARGGDAVAAVTGGSYALTAVVMLVYSRRSLGFGGETMAAGIVLPALCGAALALTGGSTLAGTVVLLAGVPLTAKWVYASLQHPRALGAPLAARYASVTRS